MQSVACVVVAVVEDINDLPRLEFIHDPEGTLLDMRFEIQAKGYACTMSLSGSDLPAVTKCL